MLDYTKLKVWQKSHRFALSVYKATSLFPREEMYALVNQLRRAAISIPSNIAEGCGRNGNSELKHFMSIAMGSANEVKYQLLLSRDLNYVSNENYSSLDDGVTEIRKMLSSYIKKISETK